MNDETKLRMRVLPGACLVGVDIDAEGCFEIDLEEASRLENLGVAELCDEADVFTLTGDPLTDEQLIDLLAAEKAITALGKVLEGDDQDNGDDGTPADDTPAEGTPAEDATAEDAPAQNAPAEDEPKPVDEPAQPYVPAEDEPKATNAKAKGKNK